MTAMLPSFMDRRAYILPEWDRLWAALQDMNIVASMHLCGREPYGIAHGPGAGGINVGVIKFGMYDTVMRLIWGGAPMRFPKLKWSMVEGGIGWIAPVVQFMDHWWDDHPGRMEPKLPETPSYYFHRQFFATFETPSRCAYTHSDRASETYAGFRLPAYRRRVALFAQKGGRELRQHSGGRHP